MTRPYRRQIPHISVCRDQGSRGPQMVYGFGLPDRRMLAAHHMGNAPFALSSHKSNPLYASKPAKTLARFAGCWSTGVWLRMVGRFRGPWLRRPSPLHVCRLHLARLLGKSRTPERWPARIRAAGPHHLQRGVKRSARAGFRQSIIAPSQSSFPANLLRRWRR